MLGGLFDRKGRFAMALLDQLSRLGLTLPPAPKPVAAYIPAVRVGELLYTSGQLPMVDGWLSVKGRVPSEVSLEQAQGAARQCVLNGLAVVGEQIGGDWSRLVRVVRLGVFVASDASFTDQPKVANGASELLGQLLGEAGQHVRTAVGVNILPLGSPVELEMVVQVR
ncbi:MAG: RidA family protein [Phycisphaeraceae bacterium]|nr:RidA family protein [Phycisphaeraceae bacterium]